MSAYAPPPPFRTRTNVLFASQSPLAVVHRTGPRRHHQLLLWDTRSDTFTPGQWMKGLVRLWDLSPDGSKLIYWAAQYHASAPRHHRSRPTLAVDAGFDPLAVSEREINRMRSQHPHRKLPRYLSTGSAPYRRNPPRENQGVWTAISTPPYFSALAIWPCLGHWTGGGYFVTDRMAAICEPENAMTPLANIPIPTNFKCFSYLDARIARPARDKLGRTPRCQHPEQQRSITEALTASGQRWIDWIDITAAGDILFSCDGSIYRHAGVPTTIGPDLLSHARRLVDLSANRFELIRPPAAAMRW